MGLRLSLGGRVLAWHCYGLHPAAGVQLHGQRALESVAGGWRCCACGGCMHDGLELSPSWARGVISRDCTRSMMPSR